MKTMLFALLVLFPIVLNAQPLTVREVQKPIEEIPPIPRYDTLSNMRYHNSSEEYKMYIGQNILFYPRNKNSTVEVNYYGNFKLLDPDTLFYAQPDTVWIKKRRKVRPEDFTIHYPVSYSYKPVYVNGQYVSFGNTKPAELLTGFYTPYEEIEGKVFKIIDCTVEGHYEFGDLRGTVFFTIKDEQNNVIVWENKIEANKYYSFFPAVIVAYYERIMNNYTGKSFIVEGHNLFKNQNYFSKSINVEGEYSKLEGELKCTNISLFGYDNEYLTPTLFFKNSKDQEFAISILFNKLIFENSSASSRLILSVPSLRSYLRNGSGQQPESLLSEGYLSDYHGFAATLEELADINVVNERKRIAEEQRLAPENIRSQFQRRVDKFTNEITISTPLLTNNNISSLILYKNIKNGVARYSLSLRAYGSTVNVGERGVIVLFTDGTKWTRQSEIDVDAESNGFYYSAYITLTSNDLLTFQNKTISGFKLYIYDRFVDLPTAEKFQVFAKEIKSMK